MNYLLIISLLASASVIALMVALYKWLAWTRVVDRRMMESLGSAEVVNPRQRKGIADKVNKRISRLSFAERIDRQLVAADSNLTVAEFLMMRGGMAFAGFVVGWMISGEALAGLLVAGIGWMAPAFQLRIKQGKRKRAFAEQLPDMLTMLVGSLRAGYGLLHAITVVEQEMPDPISTEFGRVVRETALGYSLGDALNHLVERIDNDDLELIVTAVAIQSEVGGSLADVLETISKTIRERVELKGELNAITAQQRTTGSILSALPFIVGTILMLLSPEYMMGIFRPGWPMLIPISAVIMIIFGNIVMRMVTRIDV